MPYGEGIHGGEKEAGLCPHGKLPGICVECLGTEEGQKKQQEIMAQAEEVGSEIAQKLEKETGIVPYDVIMVLGANFREPLINKEQEAPKNQSGWLMGKESRMRLNAAAQLYFEGRVRTICLTGGPGLSGEWKNYPPLAKLGRKYLIEKWGIPEKDIFDEHVSDATHNNLAYGLREMYEHNIPVGKFAILSTNYHLNRTRKMAKMMGIKADFLPAESQLLKMSPHYQKYVANWLEKAQLKGLEENEMVKIEDDQYWKERAGVFETSLDEDVPPVDISKDVAETARRLIESGAWKSDEKQGF